MKIVNTQRLGYESIHMLSKSVLLQKRGSCLLSWFPDLPWLVSVTKLLISFCHWGEGPWIGVECAQLIVLLLRTATQSGKSTIGASLHIIFISQNPFYRELETDLLYSSCSASFYNLLECFVIYVKKITCKVIPQQMLPRNVRTISCMFAEGDIILPTWSPLERCPIGFFSA